MKKNTLFTTIIRILIIFVLLGIITAGVDYFRMKTGNIPIFNLKKYDQPTRIQTFRGIFYKAERKITTSENESLADSSDMSFSVLVFKLNVPKQFKNIETPYSIETKETENCTEKAKLYYADKDIKIYTYCLTEINIKKDNKTTKLFDSLKKDNDIINDIDSKLTYLGLYEDQTTLMFSSTDNFTNNGLTMFHCHEPQINDFYIGPKNMTFQSDFCTYKEDDFKFMWELKTESIEGSNISETNPKKEILYEDEKYRYELKDNDNKRYFVITPAVRGAVEKRYPLKKILENKILTIEDLASKGLKYNKIDKIKEKEELIKKQAEEEAKKKSGLENNT